MTFKQKIFKVFLFALLITPFMIASCDKDDDDNGGNNSGNNQEANKPPKGESNFETKDSDIPLPDSLFFFDSTNYRLGAFGDTLDQALVVTSENDSVTMQITFSRSSGSGQIGPGNYPAKDLDANEKGVDIFLAEGSNTWSTYTSRMDDDDDLGAVEIKSRSSNNVFAVFKDVTLRNGSNVTSTITVNGSFNATKKQN